MGRGRSIANVFGTGLLMTLVLVGMFVSLCIA